MDVWFTKYGIHKQAGTGIYCGSTATQQVMIVWSCFMEGWQWVGEELHGLWGWGWVNPSCRPKRSWKEVVNTDKRNRKTFLFAVNGEDWSGAMDSTVALCCPLVTTFVLVLIRPECFGKRSQNGCYSCYWCYSCRYTISVVLIDPSNCEQWQMDTLLTMV